MMNECIPKLYSPRQTFTEKPVRMNGIDLKDRFSNTSILSILTRSYSRTIPSNGSDSSNLNSNNSSSDSATNSIKLTTSLHNNTTKDRPQPERTRTKDNDKEPLFDASKGVVNLFSRFSIIPNLNSKSRVLGKRISRGPGSNIYQIGAEIGRGGNAVVYQAFNVETGDFVAVKRIPLNAVDDGTFTCIQGEIDLMKRLNHPHIVEYYETIRTDGYLNIVLEYIENGSLSAVLKKFGSFSESLVALYVTQILKGLKYLHEQGVMHRDIKGANILTTKDGIVKLADFGVATVLNGKTMKNLRVDSKGRSCMDAHDVAGSPYWIAPEIIEMATPTTACDIWSVGCTIIELLTGKPPYFNKPPMAALFSIVQDEHPPLPEDISLSLKEFLLLCFNKNPVQRSTASDLLEHRWLASGHSLSAARISSGRSTVLESSVGGEINPYVYMDINTFPSDMMRRSIDSNGDIIFNSDGRVLGRESRNDGRNDDNMGDMGGNMERESDEERIRREQRNVRKSRERYERKKMEKSDRERSIHSLSHSSRSLSERSYHSQQSSKSKHDMVVEQTQNRVRNDDERRKEKELKTRELERHQKNEREQFRGKREVQEIEGDRSWNKNVQLSKDNDKNYNNFVSNDSVEDCSTNHNLVEYNVEGTSSVQLNARTFDRFDSAATTNDKLTDKTDRVKLTDRQYMQSSSTIESCEGEEYYNDKESDIIFN